MASRAFLLRGAQHFLQARTLIFPSFASCHRSASFLLSSSSSSSSHVHDAKKQRACVSPAPATAISAAAAAAAKRRKSSKLIHIVEGDPFDSNEDASIFALRVRNAEDFQRMLSASGLLCLIPASQDTATKTWRFSGVGTRCYSDLREDAIYMTMGALRQRVAAAAADDGKLRRTVRQVQNELQNRARGEEGELTEALLCMFSREAGFPDMASKQELRTVENEEVDAVLVSARAVVVGFHCNKLTATEASAAFTRASKWAAKAGAGSPAHSFLCGKAIYVALSANFLPKKETQGVISLCKRHNLLILLRNGANLSMHNSLLPLQQIVPTIAT